MRPVLALATYDVVLFVHIVAVVVAFGVTLAYPLIFAAAEHSPPAQRFALHSFQARYGRTYASYGLVALILAGAYMATDRDLWGEPWVGGPLLIAIIIGGLGGGYLAPRERKLVELSREGADDAEYRRTAKQVEKAAGAATTLVLLAIFLMVTKLGG